MNDLSKVKFKYTGDVIRSQELRKIGIQRLDILIKDMEFQKLKQGRREFRLEDGTIITCLHVFGLSYIEIFSPIYGEEKKEERIEEHFGKWAVITAASTLSLVWDIDYNKMVKLGLKQDIVDFVKKYGYKTTVNDFVDEPSSDHLLEEDYRDNYSIPYATFWESTSEEWANPSCPQQGLCGTSTHVANKDDVVTDTDFFIHRVVHYTKDNYSCICATPPEYVGDDWHENSNATGIMTGSESISCKSNCFPKRFYSYPPISVLVQSNNIQQVHYKINSVILPYTNTAIHIAIGVDFNFNKVDSASGNFLAVTVENLLTEYIDAVVCTINSTGSISTIGSLFLTGSLLETISQIESYGYSYTGGASWVAGYNPWFRTISSRKSVDYDIKKLDWCCPTYNHFFYLEGVDIQKYNDSAPSENFPENMAIRTPYGDRNLEIRACTGKLSDLNLTTRNLFLESALRIFINHKELNYYDGIEDLNIVYLVK